MASVSQVTNIHVHNTSGSDISSSVKNLVSLKDIPEYQEKTPKELDDLVQRQNLVIMTLTSKLVQTTNIVAILEGECACQEMLTVKLRREHTDTIARNMRNNVPVHGLEDSKRVPKWSTF